MFDLSDELKKIKSKLLVLSGISLFIALTKALPHKVAILGLDLSENETIAGWFILAVTLYFLVNFLISSSIEVMHYYLPTMISRKTANTTGDTIGLTAEECFPQHEENDTEIGTTSGELNEINWKNKIITYKYKRSFQKLSNTFRLSVEFAFPIIFGCISSVYLYCFLSSLK